MTDLARVVRTAAAGAMALVAVLCAPAPARAEVPCDGITAEGFGAGAVGGRVVYRVTTLDDAGPGSLREAVAGPDRCVVFDVAGEILLQDHLWIREPYITIDGFTAPPPGITLVGRGLVIRGPTGPSPPGPADAHDVVVRGIRVRDSIEDNVQIAYGAHRIVIDHVSSAGAGDGNLDITFDSHDITVSWSIIGPGGKSMLVKYNATRVSLHHTLFAQSHSRNPAAAQDDAGTPAADTTVDVRNNVVWDWGTGSGTAVHHGAVANVVANVYASPISGNLTDRRRALVVCPGDSCPWPEPTAAAWAFAADNVSLDPGVDADAAGNASAPFAAPPVGTGPACEAAALVLAEAGVRPLDGLDQALVANVALDACRATTTALATSSGSVALTEPVTFTATVSPVPPAAGATEGTVDFRLVDGDSLGTAPVADGTASLTTALLPAGIHDVIAVYGGGAWLDPSTSPAVKQVVRAGLPSATALTATANPVPLGQPVTLTASVEPLPPTPGPVTGTVRFHDAGALLGSAALSGGIASFTTSALPAGHRSITATYTGGATFEPSASPPLALAVSGGSTVALTASSGVAQAGQPVMLVATVSPVPPETATPGGMVTLRAGTALVGQVPLLEGEAVLVTGSLGIGKNTLTAFYEGQVPFAPSASPAVVVKVTKGATATALESSSPSATLGQSVRLTAAVAPVPPAQGVPAGSVKFKDGSKTLATVALVNGVATLDTSQLAAGSRSLTAVYSGETRFDGSTSPVLVQTITGAATVALQSGANPAVAGQAITLSASVSAGMGLPPPTGKVRFLDGKATLGPANLANGVAAVTVTLAVKSHTITAVYDGDHDHAPAKSPALSQKVVKGATKTTVTSSDSQAAPGQAVTFTAQVRPAAPASGTPTGTVKFMAGGKSLGNGSLSSGVARLTTTKLPAGRHAITAVYGGSSSFVKSTSPAITQDVGPD